MSYLLDTNVISEFVKSNPNKRVISWFDAIPTEDLFVSVLTLGEIRKGIEKNNEPTRKEKLRIWLEYELMGWFENRILNVNKEVADTWGRLLGRLARPVPAIDSLIAATAIQNNLSLVTRNTEDFKFTSLEVINPWDY